MLQRRFGLLTVEDERVLTMLLVTMMSLLESIGPMNTFQKICQEEDRPEKKLK
jgi:xanthine/uracil permease